MTKYDATFDQAMKAIVFNGYAVDIGQISAHARKRLDKDQALERFEYFGFPIRKTGWRLRNTAIIGLDI